MKKALTEQTRSPVLVSLESVELCVPAIPRMTNKREQVPVTNIVETAGKQSFTPLIFHGNTPKMQDRWFKAFAKVCAEVTSSFTLGMYPIGLSSSFLSHIIFNMPSSSRHIENAACALHEWQSCCLQSDYHTDDVNRRDHQAKESSPTFGSNCRAWSHNDGTYQPGFLS